MDIRVLNYFLIVAREENITKAAELLHITQPTLSRQLHLLEEELETKLFKRGKHNIYLTEEGTLFRRRAKEIVNIAEMAKSELAQNDKELSGEIIIGCSESQSMNELASIISSFRKEHPLVSFMLRSGNNIDIQEWLERGIVDIGLLVEPVKVEKYNYFRLTEKDQWGILVHEKSELAKKNIILSEDLIGVPLITVTDEIIHNELGSWSGKNADMMIPIIHYNLLSNAAPMVRVGDGVAICPRPGCQYDKLKFIPFEPKLEMGSLLAWKGNLKLSKAVNTFIEDIKKCK